MTYDIFVTSYISLFTLRTLWLTNIIGENMEIIDTIINLKKIFSERLSTVIEEYMQERQKENDINFEKENDIKDSKKNKKAKTYTKTQLFSDFNEKYKDLNIVITRQYLYNYTKGKQKGFPSEDMLIALCDFFDVSCDYLFGLTDYKHPMINSIQKTIPLDDNAIKTLINEKNPHVLSVLNALLSDSKAMGEQLSYLYLYANNTFITEKEHQETHNPNLGGSNEQFYGTSFLNFLYTSFLNVYKQELEKNYQEEMLIRLWNIEHPDE